MLISDQVYGLLDSCNSALWHRIAPSQLCIKSGYGQHQMPIKRSNAVPNTV